VSSVRVPGDCHPCGPLAPARRSTASAAITPSTTWSWPEVSLAWSAGMTPSASGRSGGGLAPSRAMNPSAHLILGDSCSLHNGARPPRLV